MSSNPQVETPNKLGHTLGLPPVAPKNLRAYADWFDEGKLVVGPELCFHPNVFSTTLRDYADGIEAEKDIRTDMLAALKVAQKVILDCRSALLEFGATPTEWPEGEQIAAAIAKAERGQ